MFLILEIRDKVKSIYQKFSVYFNVLFKFVFSLLLFLALNKAIGLDARFSSTPVSVGLAIIGAFIPSSILTLVALVLCALNLLKISYICTIIFIVIYIILWLFFLRHTSKYGYVFLATPVLLYIGAPYAIPIVFGMVATPIGSLAVMGGTIMYFLLKVCLSTTVGDTKINPDEILQLYRYIMNEFITNKEMYMYIILLVAVTVLIYAIRTRKFDYSNEVAVIAGPIVSIVVFILASMVLEINVPIAALILWSIAGAFVGYISAGFIKVLDYSSVENVQFEDDDYYYYVKAVPKLKVAASDNRVKNITKNSDVENEEDLDEDNNGQLNSELNLEEIKEMFDEERGKLASSSKIDFTDEYED